MASTNEMVKIASEIKPDTVTLVPEKREELTTEGGLNLTEELRDVIFSLKKAGIEVSVFIEPELTMIQTAKDLGADAVEIHTGRFANLKKEEDIKVEIDKIYKAAILTKELGMRAVAGHGLNYHNTQKLVELDVFEEFNIGHSIISRAVFSGLAEAILTMKLIVE